MSTNIDVDALCMFEQFLPAIRSFRDGEISEGKLRNCWYNLVLGGEYTLPEPEIEGETND